MNITLTERISFMNKRPLVLDIKGHSLDDGPGIRSVIFLKGCPLDCCWCHNPESKKTTKDILWDSEKCILCNSCIDSCPETAISKKNPFFINRDKCTLCFKCHDECPTAALTVAGQAMNVDDIVKQVIRYKDFFETSGGGVTLSGGEPTLYMEFASELLKSLKKAGIHTLLETCGHFNIKKFTGLLLPWLDEIYFDIKLIDREEHKRFCGISNDIILENFKYLLRLSLDHSFCILPRLPLIPEYTDNKEQIDLLAQFYRKHNVKRIGLMENNPIWVDKLKKLGVPDPFEKCNKIKNLYEKETKKRIKEQFLSYGIETLFV